MARLSSKLRSVVAKDGDEVIGRGVMHFCPACQEAHIFWIERPKGGPTWTWNGSVDKPTVNPSILLFTTHDDDGNKLPEGTRRTLCHYFLHDGVVAFCGDCPHELAGQNVPLPDIPDSYGGGEG